MSISAVGPVGFTPFVAPTLPTTSTTPATSLAAVDASGPAGAAAAAPGADFSSLLSQGIENLQGLHSKTADLAVQAASGDLHALHDYTISATETAVATQLTTAVRNKALEAFTEIMRMNV
jgi:flagellar hook-basal body complex protein FliE